VVAAAGGGGLEEALAAAGRGRGRGANDLGVDIFDLGFSSVVYIPQNKGL
jgi:hypothetical protein